MTWEWKIGDPVDDSNGGTMDAMNWGHGSDDDDDEIRCSEIDSTDLEIAEYTKKAWDLYMDFREEEALHYINMALDLDDRHANNWNRKAIILEGMKRYQESEECYDKSLELSFSNLVCDNKVRMLYGWAHQLIEESKKLPDGLNKLEESKEKNKKAIESRPGKNSEEVIDKYLEQRDTINFYIDYEREYQRKLETLRQNDKSGLFTITGMHSYKNDVMLSPGMPLKLVKEPENEFDKDAIAVYAEDEKIGYVANKDYTKHELTSSASQLQDKIDDVAQGSFLFFLDRYADIQFHIGRIVK